MPLLLQCDRWQGLRQEGCVGPLQGLPLCGDQVGTFVCTKGPYNCVRAPAKSMDVVEAHYMACLHAGIRREHFPVLSPISASWALARSETEAYSGPLQLWFGYWQGLRQEGLYPRPLLLQCER